VGPEETVTAQTTFHTTQFGALLDEIHNLRLASHKFAMLCLSASTLPDDVHHDARRVRQLLRDISGQWIRLRNSQDHMLHGSDGALALIMTKAFSRQAEDSFLCFQDIGISVCTQLLCDQQPNATELRELMRLVTHDLHQTIDELLIAARQIGQMGDQNASRLASVDDLSGLPNRRALYNHIQRYDAGRWPHNNVAVMQIDLDRLKIINDTMGHAAGDKALRHASAAMISTDQPDMFVARTGGDEFVLILFGDMDSVALKDIADQLIDAISKPFVIDNKECHAGASIGIATGTFAEGLPLDSYIKNADMALYTAKNGGRGTSRFFSPALRSQLKEVEELQAHIREGLQNGEFRPYFQPQVEGRSGKIVGFETLARWHHPTRGVLAPFHFLTAAEDARLLDQLDHYLMANTFATMREWINQGLDIPQVSLNLTSSRLMDIDLVDSILFAAGDAGIDPQMISVEILESAMIDNTSKRMIENIKNLSAAGIKIELDDFGTGHASISNLRHFKVDRIKIDRSFVKDVHLYSELARITSAMIGLAHSLRIDVLAEGIETPEERLVLNALGCDHIQGFGVAHPMLSDEVPAWLMKTQSVKKLPPRRFRRKA
jgi:diguanylate cyclase (GGDEF)-like protein